jgi:hypothetical protein
MNEELEPLGLPTPPSADTASTLREYVSAHPLVAVAASAAVGAGLMALITMVTREAPAPSQGAHRGTSEKFAEIQAQLGELFARHRGSLPSGAEVSRAAASLGDEASKVFNGAVDSAKHSLHGVSAAGANVTQAAMAHPLVTSLVLGALGTVLASLAASSTADAKASGGIERPNGSGQANGASA